MMRRLPLVALVATLGMFPARSARGDGKRRVALVHPDTHLMRSVVLALSAWEIEVVRIEAPPPGASLPQAERNAANLAREARANAVAWLSSSNPGSVLWIFDAETNHVGSRVLDDAPPFDEPTAAAVALSIKALLRSSSVAPAPERFGATPAPPARTNLLWLEAETGGRLSPSFLAEPRGSLGVALWPRRLDEHAGVALGASAGLGAPVTTPAPTQLGARFHDVAVTSSLRTRIRLGEYVVIEPALGGSVHFTWLEGTAGADAVGVLANRLCGSIDAALSLYVRVGSIAVGARTSLEYLPRYPRYLVYEEEALSLSPWMLEVGLRVSAGIL